eukprot:COSAG01_NODE_9764_length_2350_cov_2.392270_1_plen_80_part_00
MQLIRRINARSGSLEGSSGTHSAPSSHQPSLACTRCSASRACIRRSCLALEGQCQSVVVGGKGPPAPAKAAKLRAAPGL